MEDVKNMVKLACDALEEKKASDVRVLDITGVSVIADYFIIASGDNERQVEALSDAVDEALGRAGYERRAIEGYQTRRWILLDYNDVIIHIFNKEDRLFYDLERIWRDGKAVTAAELEAEETAPAPQA
ncbi:MAG: ribosome silencing factor [Lachnospiraceae bacterium]|nr:ribosome silencing factor [Lachnospiraceae bacterium]